MKELESKYGFPLFSTSRTTTNLLRFERNRVSDIWSFWDYIIKQHLKRNGKSTESFLSSLHEQSMYFYQAAEKAPLRSQPLLYYYVLGFVGVFIAALLQGIESGGFSPVYAQVGISIIAAIIATRGWLMNEETVLGRVSMWFTWIVIVIVALLVGGYSYFMLG